MEILNAYQQNEMGYDPDGITGLFCSDQRPLQIVKKYPHLHIISGTNLIYSNYYAPGCAVYYLSAGDPDPELECFAEAFTEECLQNIIDLLKGDQDKITDPLSLEVVRILRLLVNEKPAGALLKLEAELPADFSPAKRLKSA